MSNDALCELSDVKEWLGIKPTEAEQDDDLDWLIQSCSEQIGQFCGRDNLGTVGTYSENYRPRMATARPRIILRHYPVVAIVSITWANTQQTILSAAQVQANTTNGVFLEDDNRTLSFLGSLFARGFGGSNGVVLVNYTAGYSMDSNKTPFGLRQAAIQFVGEVYKSRGWIGFRSKSLAGETTTFEGGAAWGMSPRTKAMLQPYVNRMPPYA